MKSGRVEPELHALREVAGELAKQNKEAPGTGHLLAAIARQSSAVSDLLNERRITAEDVLRLSRGEADTFPEPIRTSLQRAHEIAVRMGFPQATATHLLVALLNEPRSVARRLLEHSGIDVTRLRSITMQLGLGLLRTRRSQPPLPAAAPPAAVRARATSATAATSASAAELAPRKLRTAVMVPTVPKPAPKAKPAPELRAEATRFELDPQKFPVLCGLGKNLTLAAARGELDPVVGRDASVEQMLDVLAKREGNNPCLVGAAGVGKTSVLRALAQRIVQTENIAAHDDKIVVELPVGELLAGTGVRGALAGRMAAIRREVAASSGRVVLFFDEIHQLFGGDAEELSSELKLALGRGELPCIGATTREEYQKALGADAALARRFTIVEVEEPSREEAFLILDALRPRLESHHRVRYSEEALALGIGWSVRYLPGRALPDKAVSILDLAGARCRRRGKAEVSPEIVAEVVAELCDMPVERLLESDGDRMLRLESLLAERVVGHAQQLQRLGRILRRNAAGLGAARPIGTFLLLGPSGVGKTETAKAIAEVLFHNESALTRIDLSEYSEAHSVARLIGAPPGYVGHEAGGQLTEAVRRRPYQVILLDELEKAHTDVLTSFLGVFDEGRLTDGRGRTIDFRNTVIVMTSNIGAGEVSHGKRRVGFGESADPNADLATRIDAQARARLAPELYNRIDEVLVFSPLSREEVAGIAERVLTQLARRLLSERGVRLQFAPEVVEFLLTHGGYDATLGARPLKRTVARYVEAQLAERILSGELGPDCTALVEVSGDELDFDVIDASAAE